MKLTILTLIFSCLFLVSCEKIIDIGIEDAESKYVIEGWVSNHPNYTYVKISKSLGLSVVSDFENISNAQVTITDASGNQITLTESDPGFYTAPSFIGQSYEEYRLDIDIEGETFSANTYIPGNTPVDSLVYNSNNGGFFGDGFTVFAYWTDEPTEKNYYRLKTIKNDTLEESFFVTKDDLFNGIGTGTPLFGATYNLQDTVVLLLMECDADTYEYYYTAGQILNTQNPPAAPGNPITNISNDALGYFGGYNIAIDTVVIQ